MTKIEITKAKDVVAVRHGYPSWEEMENWIIDHNMPVVVGQLLVGAMEEVCREVMKGENHV